MIGGLAFIFILGQLLVWQKLIGLGYYVAGNPANAYFYLFTALHGLHLIGGLIYWGMTIRKVWSFNEIIVKNAQHTVELCGIYWLFFTFCLVSLVWINVYFLKENSLWKNQQQTTITVPPYIKGRKGVVSDWSSDQKLLKACRGKSNDVDLPCC